MNTSLFDRIVTNLRGQHHELLAWWRNASMEKRATRLGDRPEAAFAEHVKILEGAIRKAEDKVLGVCEVCHDFVEEHWMETNYTSCVCLEHLSGEERSNLEAELELSQKVQQALLPQSVPEMHGWNLAAYTQPASIVGGDYFDFLKFGDGADAVVIADVMGKGMPASMLMASLQASLRIIVPASTSPEEVLSRANQIFCHNINLTKFVTIVLARLEPRTGVITYANAGHNPPLLIRAHSQGIADVVVMRPTGAAIGLVEGATFAGQSVPTGPGDLVVFYTDGVIEAMNAAGEDFGEERMRSFLLGARSQPPAEIIRNLRTKVQSFTGTQVLGDDTTVIVMKRSRL